MKNRRWMFGSLLTGVMLSALLFGRSAPVKSAANVQTDSNPVPILAYYYIWFDPGSWDRAKTDYPLLGRYSSDDEKVMLQHIRWAKEAGINGFIVSWKSTDVLNRRLDLLIKLAEQEDFKLVIIYQGLDFYRDPLPVDRIADDLAFFIEQYAGNEVFSLYAKPVVIWSGTWEFSTAEIEQVSQAVRGSILLLATEKNIEGIERLNGLVDGDAYYWSSVNTDTYPGYAEKLAKMSEAVHSQGGLWIAPAAPGFDARLVGGSSIVDRKDGDTLRTQMNAAMSSAPDAIGLISWNEFSENSHIEPSQTHGDRYLEVLSEINNLPPPMIGEFDSSEPVTSYPILFAGSRTIALAGLGILIFSAFIIIARRRPKTT